MNQNIIWKAQPSRWIFNNSFSILQIPLILLFLFCSFSQGQAQKITKRFEKEIEVSESVTVFAQSPRSIDVHGNGTITANNTKDGYIIYGKSDVPGLRIEKNFEIKTWEKNAVLQIVEISVLPEEQAEAQELLKNLTVTLTQNSIGEVMADCNMNIKTFTLKNGMFSKDKFGIILDDGQHFYFKSLEIKAMLTIPKSSNLTLEGFYNTPIIDDLDGVLELNLVHSEIKAGNIKHLKANLQSCFNVKFKKVETASISAKNSWIEIDEIDHLEIGKDRIKNYPNGWIAASSSVGSTMIFGGDEYEIDKNSSLTTYRIGTVKDLNIHESANDKFQLGQVDKIHSNHSVFSNYHIDKLNHSLTLRAKNSDLKVDKISNKFNAIEIDNELSTINLTIEEGANYLLNIQENKYSEFTFPKDLELLNDQNRWQKTYSKGKKESTGNVNLNCERCKVVIK